MNLNSKIFVAGSSGMVGSAIIRRLKQDGYHNIISITSSELDLRNQSKVFDFFTSTKVEYVFLAAAKVGGILENSTKKAEFIYDNLTIQSNVIHASYENKVKKLLFLGSSCIYPKESKIPISEDQLLSGELEDTNDAYAISKIAGIKLCQSYREQYGFNAISLMPTNLYGMNDNFDLKSSHVIPALIRKFVEAKQNGHEEVICWGSGKPLREFLHVDDLASACLYLMKNYESKDHINVGTGKDITIEELAKMIASIIEFKGKIVWDNSKPDGTFRKVLDISKLKKLGWNPTISINEGLKKTIDWYKEKNYH
tara:strand:- start:1093 stop:2025 length:933 start_codon:yes stop_codon:yes gene_type:complete